MTHWSFIACCKYISIHNFAMNHFNQIQSQIKLMTFIKMFWRRWHNDESCFQRFSFPLRRSELSSTWRIVENTTKNKTKSWTWAERLRNTWYFNFSSEKIWLSHHTFLQRISVKILLELINFVSTLSSGSSSNVTWLESFRFKFSKKKI